jgi:hypothetical protein
MGREEGVVDVSEKFSFDKCAICDKYAPLKNGVCIKCDREVDMPEFLKGMFDNNKGAYNDNKPI